MNPGNARNLIETIGLYRLAEDGYSARSIWLYARLKLFSIRAELCRNKTCYSKVCFDRVTFIDELSARNKSST